MFDVLVAPRTGPIVLDPGTLDHDEGSYRQHFDEADERASPGYYRVRLKESGVEAELTATPRVGLHRYTFPTGVPDPHLLIDLRYAMKDAGITNAAIRVAGPDLIVGSRQVHSWADGRLIHFAMKLSRPFSAATLYSNGRPAVGQEVEGANLKAALHFPDAAAQPLLVKVGLSAVDVDGALRNLEAELSGWDFEATHAAARELWERELGRIRIDGASPSQARTFYTAFYHTMMAPTLFSDVDGHYRGMDTAIHALPKGRENYSTFSLWDTYRALHPFFTLVMPERNADLVDCLIRMTAESPAGPPVWPLQGIETYCMIGWHSAVVIAEAYAKGLKGPDYTGVWPLFRKRAFEDRQLGLADYRALGFVPCDTNDESASKTLEYAYDDWAMARIAEAAAAHEDAARLRERSRNYANLFDPKLGFIRPRLANGQWAEPYDPKAIGHDWRKWRDFTESNGWEATFLNQHDLYRYMDMFGGEKLFEAKLDQLFTVTGMGEGAPPDIAGLVGQYAHGNEPSHHVAYLYAYAGAHHKTQARVRMLLETMYRDQPDGLAGNEDCGQMSAWYLMSAMGLYAVDPVSANYVFGSPLFPRVEMRVGDGARLEIEAKNVGPDNFYIQSVRWNGRAWPKSWISHAELTQGGKLVFTMGAKPNPDFGAAREHRPPSFVQADGGGGISG
jgi:predicted alpha-1,2-mannosidase